MAAQLFPRDRDCYILSKGDAFAVSVTQGLAASGWQGGQAVQWVDSLVDEFLVEPSDGLYGGFLIWGSNEVSDRFTGLTFTQPTYGYGVLGVGGWLIATRTYERYTYASRVSPPFVENVYVPGEPLRFSLRGYWTKEDEWTLSGDPRAPNGFTTGCVVQSPTSDNNFYLTVQTSI
jgi:hypothetical protein